MKRVVVGSEVTFNLLPDAVWFKVLEIDGFCLTVQEVGTDYASQQTDVSLVKRVR